jgi:predicted nucleic acid-binding protein
VSGLTLDAGGLIALDRGDRKVVTLFARALERGDRITVPATVLAQVLRSPVRQVRIVRLCRQPGTDLVPLDGPDAFLVGLLLAETHTSDIADGHVVVCARRAGQVVITSDTDDIARLAPDVRTFAV